MPQFELEKAKEDLVSKSREIAQRQIDMMKGYQELAGFYDVPQPGVEPMAGYIIEVVSPVLDELAKAKKEIDLLRDSLYQVVDSVAGEQECPIELERALGKFAPAAIERARRIMKEFNDAEEEVEA